MKLIYLMLVGIVLFVLFTLTGYLSIDRNWKGLLITGGLLATNLGLFCVIFRKHS